MEWDDEDPAEFLEEKTGALDGASEDRLPEEYFAKGLLDDGEDRAENTPEDQVILDRMYNISERALPASIDFRQYGNKSKI